MRRRGYPNYLAQGGDWGAGVTTWMAKQHVEGLAAIHLNLPILFPPPVESEPNQVEKATVAQLVAFNEKNRDTPRYNPPDLRPSVTRWPTRPPARRRRSTKSSASGPTAT